MSKIKVTIKNRFTGSIIFEYEKEDNTLKETVKEYIRKELEAGKGYANLCYANLSSADLSSADLRSANLRSADLRSADLSSADLSSANLSSADLRSAENAEYAIAMTRICPDGDIIGWKKCQDNKIVKLLIPADAKRNNAFGRKCRAEYAKVLEVIGGGEAKSQNDCKFIYKEGEIVKPDEFDEDFTNECSGGIHFFITRIEAERY